MIRINGGVRGQRETIDGFGQIKSLIRQGGQRSMTKSLEHLSEVVRKDYLSGPYPTEVERRSGSFQATWRRGGKENIFEVTSKGMTFEGKLGSTDRRARILAVGGTIRPTGGRKFLTIPTGFAKTPTGQTKREYMRPARQIPNTFLTRNKSTGQLTIWQATAPRRRSSQRLSEVAKPIFFLVREVTIKGRFYHTKAEKKATPGVNKIWQDDMTLLVKRGQETLNRIRAA